MAISYFNTEGYNKMPKDEFWKLHDSKDDYILDVFEYCKQDPDGDVWVPTVEKYFELENKALEWRLREI